MKKVIVIMGLGLACMSQVFADGGKAPSNFVVLDKTSNAYVETHEVTIESWNAYLSFIKEVSGETSEYYQESLPNDEICRQAYKTDDYLTNPEFKSYPIVGITYEQAILFCKWRTDNENRNKKTSNTTMYIYSMLTESEFQNAFDLQSVKTKVKTISAVNTKAKEVTGIADNVKEMTLNKKVVVDEGSNGLRFENYSNAAANVGFRCKVVLK